MAEGNPGSEVEDEDSHRNEQSSLWEDIALHSDDEGYLDQEGNSLTQGYKYGKQYIPGQGFSRYNTALKNFIFVRRKKKKKGSLGVDEAGLWSFLTFRWLSKFIFQAYKGGFTLDELPEGSPFDASEYNVQRLEKLWSDELTKKGPQSASMGVVAWRFMRTRIIVSSFLFCLYIISCFISVAFFMREILKYAETEDASVWVGIKWAALLTITELFRVTVYSMVWAINFRTAVRLRSACLAMLYRKILRLHSLQGKHFGELINLFSNDGQRIYELVLFGPLIIGGPISLTLCLLYVYWLLGPWAVLGLSTFFIFYLLQYGLSRLSGYIRRKAISVTDERMGTLSEILNSIKVIKLYAWNQIFSNKILDIRKREVKYVKGTAYCQSLATSFASTGPIISAIITFLAHIAAGNQLAASQVFPLMTMLTTIVRLSFLSFQYGVGNIIDLLITCKRLKSVLLLNETKTYLSRPLDKSQAVCVASGNFARFRTNSGEKKNLKKRDKEKENTQKEEEKEMLSPPVIGSNLEIVLFDINFFAPKGSLIGICGQVGSGKSSLLNAILGQLPMTSGKLCREGTCAYVAQEPWLMNATLKENVLFGEKFIPKKYFHALYCCSLNEDINTLPGGDETEIGERGIKLSGGQKQRVSLARALYSDRDIYLLDDPLSSVDAHVGVHIFEKCILTALKGKTVLFVTHQLKYLKACDDIVVMKDGRTFERGNYDELISQDGEFKIMVDSSLKSTQTNDELDQEELEVHEVHSSEEKNVASMSEISLENGKKQFSSQPSEVNLKPQPTVNENSLKGSVRLHTILFYIRSCGGLIVTTLVVLLMMLNVGSTAFSSWWLAMWIKAGSGNATIVVNNVTEVSENMMDNPEFFTYQLVYGLSIGAILFTNLLRGYIFTQVTIKGSSTLHNNLLSKVLKSPMSFFETTPIGRLHNLFAKDIYEVETRLPLTMETLIQDIWQITFAILFICLVFPYFVIPVIFLAFLYYTISKIFRVGMRELKRLENLSRSPIFSIVSTTVLGLDTIHAFVKENDFLKQFVRTFDQNTTLLYMVSIGARWIAIRLDAIAALIMLITSCMIIILHGEVPPSMAGLAIAYAASLSGLFQYAVRQTNECEMRFLSVERINMYIDGIEQEGGHGPKGIPPETWPELGTIRFSHVYLRYQSALPFALNDISFKIRSGEKIGIVGRTGSGKSSLLSALFRTVEVTRGNIKIDNMDIASIDLEVLRSRLTIIPQDPVLFSGTIRSNVDPAEKYSDSEIWSVLEKTKLKDKISNSEKKLLSDVTPNGSNLSVGEKQLLCLARALLKQSKIIVLDEATSGIDPDTENIVQQTIQIEFRQSTVLTIAHRLETISSCDRILVMENGQVVEFDEPSALLQNPNSEFSKLNIASQKASAAQ